MDGEVNGRRSPRKESQEIRHVRYVMSQGGNRVLCEVGGQISTGWRIEIEVALRAFIDRLSYQPTLLFCRHREHKDRIGELLPRHVSQLSNARLDILAGTIVSVVSLLHQPRIMRARAFLPPSKHCDALRRRYIPEKQSNGSAKLRATRFVVPNEKVYTQVLVRFERAQLIPSLAAAWRGHRPSAPCQPSSVAGRSRPRSALAS